MSNANEPAAMIDYASRKASAKKAHALQKLDAPTLMKYLVQSGKGSPTARLIDAILGSFWNPLGTQAVFPTIERIAEYAGGISEEEVESVIGDLHHHEMVKGDTGTFFRLRASSYAGAARWYSNGNAAQWATQKSPLKLSIRYPAILDGDTASQLAHALFSTKQHLGRANDVPTDTHSLATRLGVSPARVPAILEGLRRRGWTVVVNETSILASPGHALVESWKTFQVAALTASYGQSAGACETEWELKTWRPSVGLMEARKPAVTENDPVLDVKPTGWFIYRLTDGVQSYIGITQDTLRSRLTSHLTRKGKGNTAKATNRGLFTWLQDLSRRGITPRIERIAHLEEPIRRAWAESMEHKYVELECEALGNQNVFNLEHHPQHNFCRHP